MSKESLSIGKELIDDTGIGLSLLNPGIISYHNGEFERGARLLEKCLAIFRETGEEKHQAQTLIYSTELQTRKGMLDEASAHWQQSLCVSTRLEDKNILVPP